MRWQEIDGEAGEHFVQLQFALLYVVLTALEDKALHQTRYRPLPGVW